MTLFGAKLLEAHRIDAYQFFEVCYNYPMAKRKLSKKQKCEAILRTTLPTSCDEYYATVHTLIQTCKDMDHFLSVMCLEPINTRHLSRAFMQRITQDGIPQTVGTYFHFENAAHFNPSYTKENRKTRMADRQPELVSSVLVTATYFVLCGKEVWIEEGPYRWFEGGVTKEDKRDLRALDETKRERLRTNFTFSAFLRSCADYPNKVPGATVDGFFTHFLLGGSAQSGRPTLEDREERRTDNVIKALLPLVQGQSSTF